MEKSQVSNHSSEALPVAAPKATRHRSTCPNEEEGARNRCRRRCIRRPGTQQRRLHCTPSGIRMHMAQTFGASQIATRERITLACLATHRHFREVHRTSGTPSCKTPSFSHIPIIHVRYKCHKATKTPMEKQQTMITKIPDVKLELNSLAAKHIGN